MEGVVELEEHPPSSPEAKRNPFTRRVSFSDPHIFRDLQPNEIRTHREQQENWLNDWRWRMSLIEDSMSFVWTTRFRRILSFMIALSALPMQVILIIGLVREWNLHCDIPLQAWSIVLIIELAALQITNILLAKKLPPDYAPPDIRQYRIEKIWWIIFSTRICIGIWVICAILSAIFLILHERDKDGDCPDNTSFKMVLITLIVQLAFFLVLSCILATAFFRYFCEYCRQSPNEIAENEDGLSKHQIGSLLVKKYQGSRYLPLDHEYKCVICLSEYQKGEEITFLPCNHHYHSFCIAPWLSFNRHCPICIAEVIVE